MTRHRLFVWAQYAVIGICGLLAVGVVVTRTAWFKDWLRGIVLSQVAGLVDGDVQIDRLSGSLWRDVTLERVAIRQQGDVTLEVATIKATYDIVQLIAGHLAIDDIEIVQPRIRVAADAQGWNVSHLIKPRSTVSSGEARTVTFRAIRVRGGDISIEPAGRAPTHLADIEAQASLTLAPSGTSATVSHFSGRDAGTGVQLLNLTGKVDANDANIAVSNLEVHTTSSAVSGRLSYQRAQQGATIDAAFHAANLVVNEFRPYLPPGIAVDQVVSGDVAARGPLTALDASWTLGSRGGRTTGRLRLNVLLAAMPVEGLISVEALDVAAFTGDPAWRSDITANATITGEVHSADPVASRLSFTLETPRVALLGYDADALRATGSLDRGVLKADAAVRAYGADATARAVVDNLVSGRAPRVAVSGTAHGIDLRRLPRTLGVPAMATSIGGDYTASIGANRWQAALTMQRSRVEAAVIDAGARVSASAQGRQLHAAVDGSVHGLSAGLLRLPLGPSTSLGGEVHAAVTIADLSAPFALDQISGTAVALLGDTHVEGLPIDRIELDAALAGGRLDVHRFTVGGRAVALNAQGTVLLSADAVGDSDLTYDMDVSDLTLFQDFGAPGLSGLAHVTGRVDGPPDALKTSGTFAVQQLRYTDVLDALALNGTFDAKIPERDIKRIDASVHAESTFLTVKQYELQRFSLTAHYVQDRVELEARANQRDRAIEISGGVELQPGRQDVRLQRLNISGPGAEWQLVPGSEARIGYSADDITVSDLAFVRGDERVEADGRVAVSTTVPESDMRLRFSGVSVGDLYTLVTGSSRVTGTAQGQFHLTGALANPAVTGSLQVDNGRVLDVPFTQFTTQVSLRDSRATVDARILEPTAGSTFVITGVVPISETAGSMDVEVNGTGVSLGLAQAFTTHLDRVQGHATVHLHATGTLKAPVLNGEVALADAGFLLVPTGVMYPRIVANLTFDGSRAQIRELSITDDDGHSLTATGRGDLFASGGARAFDVALEANDLHVLKSDLGEVQISGSVHADGDVAAPRIAGQITVTRGRLEVDALLRELVSDVAPAAPDAAPNPTGAPGDAVTVAQTETPAPPAAAAAGPLPPADHPPAADTGVFANATLQLDLHLPDDLVLRGRDLRVGASSMGLGDINLTVGGNLEMRKAAGETLTIVGSVNAVRGFYQFQGRRFDVTRGSTVTFRGAQPINPTLDVTAQRDVSGITAQVRVTGTMLQPRLVLSSDPPLDQGDVLSLIIFNQPINELGQGEQTDLLTRAGNLAAGALATPLADSIGRALNVDLFEIRAPSSGEAGEVTIGRQVNDRLFVGFKQQFGDTDASRLSFEYRLTDALRILTSVAQGADRAKAARDREAAGVDFVYVLSY